MPDYLCEDCYDVPEGAEEPKRSRDGLVALHADGYAIEFSIAPEEHKCLTCGICGTRVDVWSDGSAHHAGDDWADQDDTHEPAELQTAAMRGQDCDCETDNFSGVPCAVCKTTVKGVRHAVTIIETVAPDTHCTERHEFNYHEYYSGPDDHEYRAEVPAITSGDDPRELVLYLSKVGGGTPGQAYTGNWAYLLTWGGEETEHGDDLRTGSPKTHEQAARIAAGFLAAAIGNRRGTYADQHERVIERLEDYADGA